MSAPRPQGPTQTVDGAQAVQFTGTTTSLAAITAWLDGSPYRHPSVATRDLRDLDLITPEGQRIVANPGDWIIRNLDGVVMVQLQLPEAM